MGFSAGQADLTASTSSSGAVSDKCIVHETGYVTILATGADSAVTGSGATSEHGRGHENGSQTRQRTCVLSMTRAGA